MTCGKHGYKYQKLCHNPSPFPRGREGSLTAKSPNLSAKKKKKMVQFNRTHSFPNLQAKFFKFMFCTLVKFPANYADSMQLTNNFCESREIHAIC